MPVEREQTSSGVEAASARQVVGCQDRAGCARNRLPRHRQTRRSDSRNQSRIDDADSVSFVQESLLVRDSHLQVVDPFHVRHIGSKARIRELSILNDGLALQVGREVIKRVRTRVVVVLIASHKGAESKYRVRTQQARPGRRNIKGLDLRDLIGCPQRIARSPDR